MEIWVKMRKVELLPIRDCKAGYTPDSFLPSKNLRYSILTDIDSLKGCWQTYVYFHVRTVISCVRELFFFCHEFFFLYCKNTKLWQKKNKCTCSCNKFCIYDIDIDFKVTTCVSYFIVNNFICSQNGSGNDILEIYLQKPIAFNM